MADVMTVQGAIETSELGPTLMHEHLYVNLMREYRSTGLLNSQQVMLDELAPFTAAGGMTVVDVTPAEIARGASPDPAGVFAGDRDEHGWPSRPPSNVLALRELSRLAGVNVVVGTGHYRDPYLGDGWLDEHSVDEISAQLVGDVEVGISGTDVRAGIIGEIGADKWFVSAREERSFRAAGRAQVRTGLALTTHAARWPVGIAQLDLLAEEGVDPRRVIIGHCDSVPILDYHVAVAERGAFVQYDLLRNESAAQTRHGVELVLEMTRRGYAEQLLLSHDVCTLSQLAVNGGSGFAFIPTAFADALEEAGMDRAQVTSILTDNPSRALARS